VDGSARKRRQYVSGTEIRVRSESRTAEILERKKKIGMLFGEQTQVGIIRINWELPVRMQRKRPLESASWQEPRIPVI
jgi:hypothetical protein